MLHLETPGNAISLVGNACPHCGGEIRATIAEGTMAITCANCQRVEVASVGDSAIGEALHRGVSAFL